LANASDKETAFSDDTITKFQDVRDGLEKKGVKFEWVVAEWFEQTPLGRFP